jgi:hypothetical protein
MASFSMTCTCDHTMKIEAANCDQALEMFKAGMTQEALDQHFRERHNEATEQKPTLEQAHAMIGQFVKAA